MSAALPWRGGAVWLGLAILALLTIASISVIEENEQAVVLRLGEPDRVINRFRPEALPASSGAGVILHAPLVEQVVRLPRGLLTLTGGSQVVTTADRQNLLLDTAVTVRVVDPVRLTRKLGGAERIATEVGAWLPSLLKTELARIDSARVQRGEAAGAGAALRQGLDARLRDSGLQVIDLRIARVSLPAAARSDTLQAMAERREALANEERNRGAREVQLITSQAEADAASLLQQSAGRDPDFYDFYRAMRSYEAIFADPERKDKATFVLPPDSGYLRQFNSR